MGYKSRLYNLYKLMYHFNAQGHRIYSVRGDRQNLVAEKSSISSQIDKVGALSVAFGAGTGWQTHLCTPLDFTLVFFEEWTTLERVRAWRWFFGRLKNCQKRTTPHKKGRPKRALARILLSFSKPYVPMPPIKHYWAIETTVILSWTTFRVFLRLSLTKVSKK